MIKENCSVVIKFSRKKFIEASGKNFNFSAFDIVTLFLIMVKRGPAGHLIFSRAREVNMLIRRSLNSVATVKLTSFEIY